MLAQAYLLENVDYTNKYMALLDQQLLMEMAISLPI